MYILCNIYLSISTKHRNFFGMSVMAAWTISGYAMFLSITFDEKSAQLMMVILCLIHLLYAGIQTTLRYVEFFKCISCNNIFTTLFIFYYMPQLDRRCQSLFLPPTTHVTINSSMSPPEYLLSWVSPSRWLIEDLFICHTAQLSAVYRLPPTW
jgi:hypothetical protein